MGGLISIKMQRILCKWFPAKGASNTGESDVHTACGISGASQRWGNFVQGQLDLTSL